jgi:LysM repeat protein
MTLPLFGIPCKVLRRKIERTMQLPRDNRSLLLIGGGLFAIALVCAGLSLLIVIVLISGNDRNRVVVQSPTTFVIATPAAPVNTPTQQPTMTAASTPSTGNTSSNTSGNIPPGCTVRTDWPLYTVVVGDTLGSIALRTGSTISALATANCLNNPDSIQVGQPLRVPVVPIPPTLPPTVIMGSPQIVLSPSFGTVNTPITAAVSNFPANVLVDAHLGPGPNQFSAEVYASAVTNGGGTASLSFLMPEQWTQGIPITSDIYVVVAAHNSPNIRAYSIFTWSMTRQLMFINPINVTAGTPVTVALSGFPANREVGIHLGRSAQDYDAAAILTITTDTTGAASVQFNLPDHWQDNTPITINKLFLVAVTLDLRFSAVGDVMYTPIVQTVQ